MRRREFITLLGGAAMACPLPLPPAHGQTHRVPIVGFLGFATEAGDRVFLDAFRRGLREVGRIEGKSVEVVNRHAGGDMARAGVLIAELVSKPVDVFLAPGPTAARALRRATTIPVVAVGLPHVQSDPELFDSLARPGGTVTGFAAVGEEVSAKHIEILRETLPGLTAIGVLHTTADPNFRNLGEQSMAAVRERGLKPVQLGVNSTSVAEFSAQARVLRAAGGQALLVIRDFLTDSMKDEICRAAAEAGIAVVAEQRAFAEAGALFTYGADIPDLFRRAAGYIDKILQGEKPGDLPVQLPTKFQMVVNLKTAKSLGLTLSPSLLARADELIE